MFEKRLHGMRRYLWSAILPFVLVQTAFANEETVQSLINSGSQANSNGNYNMAEGYFRRAVQASEGNGSSDSKAALALGDLANVLLTVGRFEESEALFDRSIALIRSSANADQRHLPILLGDLGNLYRQTGRFRQSEKTLNEALKLGVQILGQEPGYIAGLHNSLGLLQLETGNLKQAERNFKKALDLIDKDSGSDPRLSQILANLAVLYDSQHNWGVAEQMLRRSLSIVEQSRGPEHPDVCVLLENLGILYFKQNDLIESETMLRRALAIRRKTFGPDSAHTAGSAAMLARVLAAHGAYDEAEDLFAQALKTQEQVLGQRAPMVASTLEQFASLLHQSKKNDALALDMEARAKSIRLDQTYTVPANSFR